MAIAADVEAGLAIDSGVNPTDILEMIALRLEVAGVGRVEPCDWTYDSKAQPDDQHRARSAARLASVDGGR